MTNPDEMTGAELGEKLLQAVREMQAGLGWVVYSPAAEADTGRRSVHGGIPTPERGNDQHEIMMRKTP